MNNHAKKYVEVFNQDVNKNQGYLYTTNASLSSQIANQRLSDVTLENINLEDKTVLDIGCGDGAYTIELFDKVHVKRMLGVDYAADAIQIAKQKSDSRLIEFDVQSANSLPYDDNSFDIAIIRGVLHHLDDPVPALKEALRVAKLIWVIEPNGYNLGLKVIEKLSSYHREHQEKSYLPIELDNYIQKLDGKVLIRKWAGLVPFFCPDWLAKILKTLEPLIEALPGINQLTCAVYIFLASQTHQLS